MQGVDLSLVCDGLLSRIFPRRAEGENRGLVVALTSPHPRAGVSYITKGLSAGLHREGDQFAMLLNGRYIAARNTLANKSARLPERAAAAAGFWQGGAEGFPDDWHSMQSGVAIYLERLRREYRYILIDCPSLREAEPAVILAPLVDGVVMVVEANRTRKDQLLYAERTIENAGGRILGHVLNKRSYVIPDWLHHRLEALGI